MSFEDQADDLDTAATAVGYDLFADLEVLDPAARSSAIRTSVLAVAAVGRTTVDEATLALLEVLLGWIRDSGRPASSATAAAIVELAQHGDTASRAPLLAALQARRDALHLDSFAEELALAHAAARSVSTIIPIHASAPFWVAVIAGGRTIATAGSPAIRGSSRDQHAMGSTLEPVRTRLGGALRLVAANQTGEALHVRVFGVIGSRLQPVVRTALAAPLPDGVQCKIDYVVSEASTLVVAAWASDPPPEISTFSELTASEPHAVRIIELTVE